MRILIASQAYYPSFNGQAIFTINLAEGLAGSGHQVLMVEKLRSLQRRHPHEPLHLQCFHLALMASVLALCGESDRAAQLRDEALAYMYNGEPAEEWWRPQNY